jgi:hypothetical protein
MFSTEVPRTGRSGAGMAVASALVDITHLIIVVVGLDCGPLVPDLKQRKLMSTEAMRCLVRIAGFGLAHGRLTR